VLIATGCSVARLEQAVGIAGLLALLMTVIFPPAASRAVSLDGGLQQVATYTTRSGWGAHLAADVTGDGRAELLSYHPSNGTWWMTSVRSDGSFRSPRLLATYTTRSGWGAHLAADVTGDGRAELLSYHPSNGTWWKTVGDATDSARPSADTPATTGEADSPFNGRRHLGVATPGNAWNTAELAHVAELAGARPSIVLHYLGFVDELQPLLLRNVADADAIPFVTWEPFDWRAAIPTAQPDYALRRISDGSFDPYLTRTARTLAAFDEPVLLRFAHEMNGDWYPWSELANGNRPGEYIAAWRHVHGLFEKQGVDNVYWVWSPNVEYPGSQSLVGLYPGDDYVDVIALDGYNWGSSAASGWQTPAEVFEPTLTAVRRLAPGMPLMIGETASSEHGGNKAAWNLALFEWLARQPDVEALVWFHLEKEDDWRIDSSAASAIAFREGFGRWLAG
jgi:hypothetical protein